MPEVDNNVVAKKLGVTGFSPLADFLRLHAVKAMEDRAGNGPEFWNAANIKTNELGPERHGYDAGVDDIMYDKVNPNQDYYQAGIYDDLAKARVSQAHQDAATDGEPMDTDKAIAIKNATDDERMKAHAAVQKMMNFSAFRNGTDA